MIAFLRPLKKKNVQSQCDKFLDMLPSIRQQARFAFRGRHPNEKAELVQEVVAAAYVMFANLVREGREHLAFPTPLAQYALRQVRSGRKVGITLNVNDVTSEHAQRKRGFRLESLNQIDMEEGQWLEALVEDKKAGPADTAAARIDVTDWYRSLPIRDRKIAKVLATGDTTGAVAKKFGISVGRVSQLRRKLEESWREFQGERVTA